MSLKCGIVGLPNVGKSTLFNALTKAGIAAENYPFCTIEPNVGIVEVPDRRLDVIAEIAQPQKVVPAVVEFVDIAGLVKGASQGQGLGNQFLGHIRETDSICQVVRVFHDPGAQRHEHAGPARPGGGQARPGPAGAEDDRRPRPVPDARQPGPGADPAGSPAEVMPRRAGGRARPIVRVSARV